jgi:hypothetical protein
MLLSNALDLALFVLAALSLLVLLIAAFLPHEQRMKLLRRLGRKWII